MATAVATDVKVVVITSSPALTPAAINARMSASVPDATNGVRYATIGGELGLKSCNLTAKNEAATVYDTLDCLSNGGPYFISLAPDIPKWHYRRRHKTHQQFGRCRR